MYNGIYDQGTPTLDVSPSIRDNSTGEYRL